MKVVVLVGGVGGARFLLGLKEALGLPAVGPAEGGSPHEVVAVVNTADDVWLHGLRVCPDLDTCMYTLGGGIDSERGWGRAGETWAVKEELAAYGADPTWFGLGDRDVATHLVRSRMLRAGYPLSAVTEGLCARWQPGVSLLPMSDDRVETHVVVDLPGGERRAIHFQEWWVRYRAELPAQAIVPVGAEEATPGPGVLDAIGTADAVLVAPSNPVVSIDTILSVPGIRDALRGTSAGVVGLSPIVDGRALRGMADACLSAIGVRTTAEAVGRHYAARTKDVPAEARTPAEAADNTAEARTPAEAADNTAEARTPAEAADNTAEAENGSASGILDGWLVHETDRATVPGVTVRAVPLLMSDVPATADMARAALDLAGVRT